MAWTRATIRVGRQLTEIAGAGTHWIRRANDQLEELLQDPITHHLGFGPHEFQKPERLS